MSIYRLKGASGPVINQSHTLGPKTLIGRADDCDLRINAEGVASHHAEILQEEQGGLTLTHLDPGFETVLNGEPVQHASLGSGDEIRISKCRFVLQAPGLRPDRVLAGAAASPSRGWIPWVITGALLGAAAAAWYFGLLTFTGFPGIDSTIFLNFLLDLSRIDIDFSCAIIDRSRIDPDWMHYFSAN